MDSVYSDNTGFDKGITDNLLEHLDKLYKHKWNKYGIYQEEIHKRMDRETEDERRGYNLDGYDVKGYDIDGYDRDGYDANGYDIDGYDIDGYDIDGYDIDGYDANGYDIDGYDIDGYDRYGYDVNGLHKIRYGGNNKKKTYRKRINGQPSPTKSRLAPVILAMANSWASSAFKISAAVSPP